jgi:succinoglycan biosynthesis protein ExoA
MKITVAITTFSEGEYLDRLLQDLSRQNFSESFEIILVEAGKYDLERAQINLGCHAAKLVFHHLNGLSRTRALNFIFAAARGDLIVRLDARSHVNSDYLTRIHALSVDSGAANVGGIMKPIALTESQAIIANIMDHPLSFGGARARQSSFSGFADSVYLGAFRKSICGYGDEWFDSAHPRISEDSDLNYRIRWNGGKVFVDSAIVVGHYPREDLKKFFRLCFNYGVGRGIFVIKHRLFSAYRQLVPPISLFVFLLLSLLSFFYPLVILLLFFLVLIYVGMIFFASFLISKDLKQIAKLFSGFVGCHGFWTAGLIFSPVFYLRELRNAGQ